MTPRTIPTTQPANPNAERITHYLNLIDSAMTPLRQLQSVLEISLDQPVTLDVARAIVEKLIFSGGLDFIDIHPDSVADLIALMTWFCLGEEVDDA